jgi:2-dehydropantoate 2-reductase
MRIAIIGTGAIGGLVGGYLKMAGQDVVLVGHKDSVEAINKKGLSISGVRGNFNIKVETYETLNSEVDLVILATKIQDVEEAVKNNLDFIKNSVILTTQNGLKADDIVAKFIPKEKIISSIVMFGATYLKPGEVVHNFEGNWIIGKLFSENEEALPKIKEALEPTFKIIIENKQMKGMKYLKIFINANNCLPAILGKSMQEVFSDTEISRISISLWKEGLDIVKKAGINLVSLPDFPVERITKLTSLPLDEAAKIYSGIMTNLSKEPLYGSILQSIKRGRPSEIDYINGEFVELAQKNGMDAPLNKKLIDMVHQVEKTKRFFAKKSY